MWAARRASREGRILSVLGLYLGGGTASAEGDAAPVSRGATATALGSGAGLLQVAPEGPAAAVGWRPGLDNDDDTHCSGGAERVVLGESEASAPAGSRVEGIVGGRASGISMRLLLRLPSLVDARGTTRTPGGEAPHTASFSRDGVAQAMPWAREPCPWRDLSRSGSGNPAGAGAPSSSMCESDSSSALDMLGMLSRRTSLGSMSSLLFVTLADMGRATVIAAAVDIGSSLGRTRLMDRRTRSMAAG